MVSYIQRTYLEDEYYYSWNYTYISVIILYISKCKLFSIETILARRKKNSCFELRMNDLCYIYKILVSILIINILIISVLILVGPTFSPSQPSEYI